MSLVPLSGAAVSAAMAVAVPSRQYDHAYAQTLLDLLPPGLAWNRDATELRGICEALGIEPTRIGARAANLSDEMLPDRATELLGEWEALVGLPVPSSTDLGTRRLNVLYWLTMPGRQDRAYWVALAALAGFTVTIVEYSPFVAGSPCGDPLSQTPWQFVWDVVGAQRGFEADTLLAALFQRLSAEHTYVRFFLT